MNYLLIYNPTSHQGKSKYDFEKILSLFRKNNVDFEYITTSKKDEAIDLAYLATKGKFDNVVAVGGDGTICEAITGLMSQLDAEKRPNFGVLHVGTSPDFNRYHNIPINLEKAIGVLLKAKTKAIDVGKITYMSEKKEISLEKLDKHPCKKIAFFASNVNIGIGPKIASKANSRHRKYLGDFAGTLLATLNSILSFGGINLKIRIDDNELYFHQLFNLTIGKDPYLASGMRVFSNIQPDDGQLYILSVETNSKISLLFNLARLYRGDFLKYSGAKLRYAEKVEIAFNEESPEIEFDGDFRGYLPVKIEVLPKKLKVIVNES